MEFKWNMDTMGLFARKQWGKSTIIKALLKSIPKDRILILDTNREYKGYNRIIPKDFSINTLEDFFFYGRKFRNVLLVVEDIDVYFDNSNAPTHTKSQMINGSHQNLGLIYTSKRPKRIPRILLSEATHMIIGGMVLKEDLDYIKSIIEIDPEVLKKLKRYWFVHWYETGETKLIMSKP